MNLFFPLIVSFFVSAALVPVARKVAERFQLFDEFQGDSLKIHTRKTSFLGGGAIAVGTFAALALFAPQDMRLAAVLFSSLLVFGLGLYDDLKWKRTSSSRPLLKLFSLLLVPSAAALILSFGTVFAFFLAPFVFLYIFAFINALNYQDGMDGLAGTLSVLSFAGFAVAGLIVSNPFVLVLSLALLGAVLGFLLFNFPPAKIFMGDSGAYFLGFCLAVLALLFSDFSAIQGVLGPVFLMGVPLFEGIFTNIRRVVQGASILRGDRRHVYDTLLCSGLSVRAVLFLFATAQALSVILGLWLLL